jgi:2-oxoisovalerate dehydrogenase E1 component
MARQSTAARRSGNIGASPETMARLLHTMLRIRRFDEKTAELFAAGVVRGTAHSYVGEEAVAAGTCLNLTAEDYIGSNHRGHGHCIAKGASTDRMMAELMGKATGYCRGLGGSMHIADLALNILGANGIVGATMPMGTGAALAEKLRGSRRVVVAFFGDGASNQGVFHESMNLAATWKLPIVFVCENNQYALTTFYRDTTAVERIAVRAAGYGVPGRTIDGNDALEVHAVVGEAIERARDGHGPSLIEALTWRWGQHSMRANLREPRSDAEMAAWKARDPIVLLEQKLVAAAPDGAETAARLRAEVEQEIEAAVAFGMAGPEPDVATMHAAVTAPHVVHTEPAAKGERELTFTAALNEALAQEMERDPRVFLMGEDVGETGGIFQVSKGLWERFGAARVRDTPLSEASFCGAGVGAAIAGMRPVVEVQIFDFVTQMMDMIVNQAAKFRYMNGGVPSVPLVVRGPQGGGIRMAAQHSQSLEAWFAHVPGLVVVAPSTPYDAKGLLTAAIRDDNPVIFLEHKMLYLGQTGPVPEEPYAIPLGRADIKRPGRDVTIVATQAMVARALAAAQVLEREGIDAEVIDPRTLRPLDEETLLGSIKRTGRMVVVHEACLTGGWGAEVAARMMEKAFDWLDAPVLRVGGLDVPMPYNDVLETAVIPTAARIADAVRSLFR